jgi:hypothetical protein
MSVSSNKRQRSKFFLVMGFTGVLAVLIGFAKTFFIPVADRSFKAPFSVYLHGFFAFAWVLFFLSQSVLIHSKKVKLHMRLGLLGTFLAFGTAITLVPVGIYTVEKELGAGLGDTAISGILAIFTSGLMFLALFTIGYLYRKNLQAHKRLMLLATIVVLWPAWFRFRHYFPHIERPDIWFAVVLADSLIIIAWVWDWTTNRKIHPVLLYLGMFIILEHSFEVLTFDSEPWRRVARAIYSTLSVFG